MLMQNTEELVIQYLREYDMAERAFKINGVALPTPDNEIQVTEEDMHSKSWRDGKGIMHLVVLRRGVRKIPLSWAWMTQAELDTLKNACRTDLTGTYTLEDLQGNTYTVYTGSDLKYTMYIVDEETGETLYKDVSLSLIEV